MCADEWVLCVYAKAVASGNTSQCRCHACRVCTRVPVQNKPIFTHSGPHPAEADHVQRPRPPPGYHSPDTRRRTIVLPDCLFRVSGVLVLSDPASSTEHVPGETHGVTVATHPLLSVPDSVLGAAPQVSMLLWQALRGAQVLGRLRNHGFLAVLIPVWRHTECRWEAARAILRGDGGLKQGFDVVLSFGPKGRRLGSVEVRGRLTQGPRGEAVAAWTPGVAMGVERRGRTD